jgi:hypothetical protein
MGNRSRSKILWALEAGFQGSITGLLARGKNPDKALAEDAPMASRIAGSIGATGRGYSGNGGRRAHRWRGRANHRYSRRLRASGRNAESHHRRLRKREATNWKEFWDRASGAMIETAKGYITGAATGAVGKAAGMLPIASPTAKAAATVSGEVATMVTVGKALEGEVPSADDFIDAAVVSGA